MSNLPCWAGDKRGKPGSATQPGGDSELPSVWLPAAASTTQLIKFLQTSLRFLEFASWLEDMSRVRRMGDMWSPAGRRGLETGCWRKLGVAAPGFCFSAVSILSAPPPVLWPPPRPPLHSPPAHQSTPPSQPTDQQTDLSKRKRPNQRIVPANPPASCNDTSPR